MSHFLDSTPLLVIDRIFRIPIDWSLASYSPQSTLVQREASRSPGTAPRRPDTSTSLARNRKSRTRAGLSAEPLSLRLLFHPLRMRDADGDFSTERETRIAPSRASRAATARPRATLTKCCDGSGLRSVGECDVMPHRSAPIAPPMCAPAGGPRWSRRFAHRPVRRAAHKARAAIAEVISSRVQKTILPSSAEVVNSACTAPREAPNACSPRT